jgi:chemotaxis protein methyltransferase CheR
LPTNPVELTDEEFEWFRALIYNVAGIQVPPTKRVLVSNRVRRRLRSTAIGGFSDYYAYLISPSGAAEMPLFLDAITTNETYFYRDVHHFDWLSTSFFPELAEAGRQGKRSRSLRIWSAAASTGEELYSIALRLAPLKPTFQGWSLNLLGTDLSGEALASAIAGTYDERAVRRVGPEERGRYFDHDATTERWTVKKEIRSMATWRIHNLLLPIKERPFDCVFLKNVLIYFDVKSKQVVTRNLIAALGKGGYLVVGPTEGIHNMLEPLERLKPWLYRVPSP